ncbi:MAG: hypothetical protein KY445_01670 [Armatimonadetes bacterium]|nr:hypothetical protein [Armatimonadota bacterium]
MPHSPTSNSTSASPQEAGLSPTPTDGLSERGVAAADIGISGVDPNANALNSNADAAQMRQLTGEVPGAASADNPGGLPAAQSPEFRDGT